MDYLCADTEIRISASDYLRRGGSKVRPVLQSAIVWQSTKLVNLSEFVWGIWIPLVFKTGGPYDSEIISQWMFYRGLLDSLLYLPAFSLLVSLDSLTLVQLFAEGKKKKNERNKKKRKPCLSPPPPLFLLSQKSKHILNIHKVQKQWLLYLLSYCGWQGMIT